MCDSYPGQRGLREHARVVCDGQDYAIEDLGSANGTFLNGMRIQGNTASTRAIASGWAATSSSGSSGEPRRSKREVSTTSTSTSVGFRSQPWSPSSWEAKIAVQQPKYEDQAELKRVVEELRALPPLVTSWEIERLKSLIAEAQMGERFLLQGGDCAEMFSECEAPNITGKLKILLQMSLILTHAARKPVIRVGRFAGQYAKPRSKPTEIRNGVELPSYVGDLVNRPEFTCEARRPDPKLLVAGYYRSALTIIFIRALCSGGFSDLRVRSISISGCSTGGDLTDLRAEYTRIPADQRGPALPARDGRQGRRRGRARRVLHGATRD